MTCADNARSVQENNTVHMPSKAKSKMRRKENQKAVVGQKPSTPQKQFPFMKLPRELRDDILSMTAPDHIVLSMVQFAPGRDPTFVSTLAQLGIENLRLECVLAVLRNSTLKLSSLNDLNNLKTWLASIDFAPVCSGRSDPLEDGFDAVRKLSFSDVNRRTGFIYIGYQYDQNRVTPSSWADDVELTRMCKDLRNVELEVTLPDFFVRGLLGGGSMVEVMEGHDMDDSQTHQVSKLLRLEGLKVLRLCFYSEWWEDTLLNVEHERMITSWLQEEFEKRGQSVEVKSDFDWWDADQPL